MANACSVKTMKKSSLFLALVTLFAALGNLPATAEETATVTIESAMSCADGGTCALGDIGPGGGMVFYVRTQASLAVWLSTPNAEGDLKYAADGWKYLEVAPKTWSGSKSDPTMKWCSKADTRASWTKDLQGRDWNYKWVPGKAQTGYLASTGFGNTEIIAKNCKSGAATSARKYRGGGLSDWYLPRQTELNQLTMFAGGKFAPISACCSADFPKKQSSTFASSKYAVNWASAYMLSSFQFGKLANQNQGPDKMGIGVNSPNGAGPFVRPIRAF